MDQESPGAAALAADLELYGCDGGFPAGGSSDCSRSPVLESPAAGRCAETSGLGGYRPSSSTGALWGTAIKNLGPGRIFKNDPNPRSNDCLE